MKIGILGIGGIGGLVGSALAKNYENIYFISRGESLKAIKKDGLTLKSDKLGTFTVTPALATENAEEIGLLDVLIISTKNYGLESACRQCQNIIDKNTIIIPLLNGVNISKDVEKFLKEGEFAEGCIYGFSSIEKAGVIRHIGDLCNIYFGFQDGRSNEKCLELEKMLNNSGINTVFSNNIMAEVWKKYIMMCGNSCVFSYFQCAAGEVHKDFIKMKYIEDIYTELYKIANSRGVTLEENLIPTYVDIFKKLPEDAITSLYRDLKNPESKSEFHGIIGKGYHLAREAGLSTPCLNAAYEKYEDIAL